MRHFIELIEQADFFVLFEATARVDFLLKTYGAKLAAKFQAEPEAADIVAGVNMMTGETLAEKLVAYLLHVDPTKNQQNGQWLVVRYLKNALKLEDLERAADVLEKYEAMKQARTLPPGANDINTVKSLADLFQIVKGAETGLVTADQAEQQTMLAQTKLLYDGPDCKILIPTTQAAACFFGRNTEWCTAWGDHQALGLQNQGRHPGRSNRYDFYAPSGPLYIITLKGARDGQDVMLQYHSETGQFMDVDDRQVSTAYVHNLLKTYPVILKTIGEAKFAASHLEQLGISFFSPRVLAQIKPDSLVRAIRSKADFDALPDAVKTTDFIAAYLYAKRVGAKEVVPQSYFTSEVAAALAQRFQNAGRNADWQVFELFPVGDWPPQTLDNAVREGRLTYNQYMQLPDDQRSPEKLKRLIEVSADKNPEVLASYPAGLLTQLDITNHVLAENRAAIEFLHDADLTDENIRVYASNHAAGAHAQAMLAYVPPHRLTERLMAEIRDDGLDITMPGGEDGQTYLKKRWVETLARTPLLGDLMRRPKMPMPQRYARDPLFWEAVMHEVVMHPRFRTSGLDHWFTSFFEAFPADQVTPGMLELLVRYKAGETDRLYHWRLRLLGYRPIWTDTMIRTALKRKFLTPADITEAEITPAIAATLFRLDPARQALTYQADDASLVDEIETSSYTDKLIDHIPVDRITEPIAFAAVKKSFVDTAKKRFPKAALSQRVYFAGIPYSFELKDVPKKWRDDAMMVRAVSRSPGQLKYVPEPLAWLNAHPNIADETSGGFTRDLEAAGFVAVKSGFARITDLPTEKLINGYVLSMAEQPKKIARWFLRKGDSIIAKLEIKNNKLRLDNEHPTKDLEPVLRDIAKRFLTQVSDISILNKVGIYRDRDGSLRDPSTTRTAETKKLIDGIEWSQTAHLKGKLYTAWKGETAILTAYTAPSGGWGGSWPKVQKVEILDQPQALADNLAIKKGFSEVVSRDPENGRWELMNIGIGYKDRWGYWIMTDEPMGKVGPFRVFYSPGQRVISIFGNKGLAAYCGLLMTGKVAREHVYDWLYPKDSGLLAPTLAATAAKIGPTRKR